MPSPLHRIRVQIGRKFARFHIVGQRRRKHVRESIFLYPVALLPLCAIRIGFRHDTPNTARPFQWVVSFGIAVSLKRCATFEV
jgi:hypothetical protein